MSAIGYFVDGEKHGEWMFFNSNGVKVAVGQYFFGEPRGSWLVLNSSNEFEKIDASKDFVLPQLD